MECLPYRFVLDPITRFYYTVPNDDEAAEIEPEEVIEVVETPVPVKAPKVVKGTIVGLKAKRGRPCQSQRKK
jgi:hypothetical protein